jgi:hypothetical protein
MGYSMGYSRGTQGTELAPVDVAAFELLLLLDDDWEDNTCASATVERAFIACIRNRRCARVRACARVCVRAF